MSTASCSQTALYRSALTHENERRTRRVVALNFMVMVMEIAGGVCLGSMALLADGFHMATHVGALGISAFAYAYARKHAEDRRYSFGTGKVSDLAGFTSALILGMISFYVIYESICRLVAPVPIVYGEAIVIAALGLCVNLASAFMLHDKNPAHDRAHHHHDHENAHDHGHHHDHNYRSAYIHVVADAMTSILAIAALLCGWKFGWRFMDPLVGMVGAGVILSWTWNLLQATTGILLDRAPKNEIAETMRGIINSKGLEITDLHLWRVGNGCHAAILSLAAQEGITPHQVRQWLGNLPLAHLTIEINESF